MTTPLPTKNELRSTMLAKRQALSAESSHELSQKIQVELIHHSLFKGISSLGIYSPVKNEVDTTLIFMTALERSVNVYFPRVEQGLEFYEVSDPSDLQKGAWGILEPKHHCHPLGPSCELDLLVIPGVVFDQRGYRIGYGKGFYDGILSRFSGKSCALAYDFQIIPELPHDSWDCRVGRIFSEVREYLITP